MSYPFSDPSTSSELPPLRIHHFMLWTVVAAVMLTVLKADAASNPFSTEMEASGIPYLLVSSVSLTGLFLGMYWRHHGLPFFDEPGQTAFIFHGVVAIYQIVSTSVSSGLRDVVTGNGLNMWFDIPIGIGWLVVGIGLWLLYFRFARLFEDYGWWGKFFKVLAIIAVLQIIGTSLGSLVFILNTNGTSLFRTMVAIHFGLPILFGAAEIACWGIAVRTDTKEGRVHHWTHWLGACTWPAYWLVTILTLIATFLFPPDFMLNP